MQLPQRHLHSRHSVQGHAWCAAVVVCAGACLVYGRRCLCRCAACVVRNPESGKRNFWNALISALFVGVGCIGMGGCAWGYVLYFVVSVDVVQEVRCSCLLVVVCVLPGTSMLYPVVTRSFGRGRLFRNRHAIWISSWRLRFFGDRRGSFRWLKLLRALRLGLGRYVFSCVSSITHRRCGWGRSRNLIRRNLILLLVQNES
jgi:hypothetical protein